MKVLNVRGRRLPVISLAFPRRVTAIHQIEITSRCNLRCAYCPSPQIMKGEHPNRPAMDMTPEVFARALALAAGYVRAGSQFELNLAGIGESTLHPEFARFVVEARAAVGGQTKLILATNGLIVNDALVEVFQRERVEVWVSAHRPEKASGAIHAYRAAGVLGGISVDPSLTPNDWGGQVKWHNAPGNELVCEWLRTGRVMVLSDGRLTACCIDATGNGVVGHVNDETEPETKPFGLCRTCHHVVGVEGYDQRAP